MGARDPVATARRLVDARLAGQTLRPLSDDGPLPLAEAYAIQGQVTTLRLARGEHVIGWKLGYTSLAMREQMGVESPNYGPLTDAMTLPSGSTLPNGALQPRVEPEVGLVIGRRLSEAASVQDVLDACSTAVACLEVVDSVWTDYRFTLEDNTADGSSAAWVVVGDPLPLDGLAELAVTLTVDGSDVAEATGAAASGHPAAGVVWLVEQLASRGGALEAGNLVITGGLTAAAPLSPGGQIEATFGAATTVSVAR